MKNQFNLYLYDRHMALKVTFVLWLSILWATHPVLVLVLSAFSRSGYVFHVVLEYAGHTPLLLSTLPAFLILLTALNRSPASGKFMRLIWRHGIKLLLLSLFSGAALTVYYHKKMIAHPNNIHFWVLLLDFVVAAFLLLSAHTRAIFADFPVPPDTDKAPAKSKNLPIEN